MEISIPVTCRESHVLIQKRVTQHAWEYREAPRAFRRPCTVGGTWAGASAHRATRLEWGSPEFPEVTSICFLLFSFSLVSFLSKIGWKTTLPFSVMFSLSFSPFEVKGQFRTAWVLLTWGHDLFSKRRWWLFMGSRREILMEAFSSLIPFVSHSNLIRYATWFDYKHQTNTAYKPWRFVHYFFHKLKTTSWIFRQMFITKACHNTSQHYRNNEQTLLALRTVVTLVTSGNFIVTKYGTRRFNSILWAQQESRQRHFVTFFDWLTLLREWLSLFFLFFFKVSRFHVSHKDYGLQNSIEEKRAFRERGKKYSYTDHLW